MMQHTPENVVISWVEADLTPPLPLASLVSRYRDLQVYRDFENNPEPLDQIMDRIFDRLLNAAGAWQFWGERLPYQAACDRAIGLWRQQGVTA